MLISKVYSNLWFCVCVCVCVGACVHALGEGESGCWLSEAFDDIYQA